MPQVDSAFSTKRLISKNIASRAAYRRRLSTLFNFAVRRDYIIKNPCSRFEALKLTRPDPHVLTVDETTALLKWLLSHPRLLGWFCLSTFAGLRPEEAEKTTWRDVNFEEGWIRVQAQTTKTRQRRIVYPKPIVFDWLRVARDLHCALPINYDTRNRLLGSAARKVVPLRAVVGWPAWKKDVTRHTAASMWFSVGSAETVTKALGHSESMLREHYMALVTKTDAEKFWQLTPDFIKNLPDDQAPQP
jgi:integrase